MSFVAPVIGAVESPESQGVLPPVERQVPTENPKADFSSLQALQQTAPEIYRELFNSFGSSAVIKMGREEARRKQRVREAEAGR